MKLTEITKEIVFKRKDVSLVNKTKHEYMQRKY